MHRRRPCAAALLALLFGPASAGAFRGLQVGELLREREMPTLDGTRAPLLGRGQVAVVVFFRTGQDHSLQVLQQLAVLEKELSGKPVRFAAVTSDSYDRKEIRALAAEAGIRMPVLIDEGDALYGELQVALHPVVGIVGADHRLVSYQHFLKINMLDAVRARILHALGTIGDAELDRALHPPRPPARERSVAHHRVALGRALLQRGRVEQALDSARKAVESDAASGEAHAFLAEALAASGRCTDARASLVRARDLAPSLAPPPLPGCTPPGPAR